MALPAIRALMIAGCDCTLVGRGWGESLFAALERPYIVIDGSLFADRRRVRARRNALGGDVRGVVLPNSIGSALLFVAAGVPSAGLATGGRSALLRWPIAEPGQCHEVERFYAVAQGTLAAWALQPPAALSQVLALDVTAEQDAAAQRLLAERQVGRYALLAPVATGVHHGQPKHWSHFAALMPELRQRGLQPLAAPPVAEVDAVRAALPGATLLPPVALGVFAALAGNAAVVIANDSGSSHVAAAVGARQVTIFGVTDRQRTGPWSRRAVCVGANGAWPSIAAVIAAIDEALALP